MAAVPVELRLPEDAGRRWSAEALRPALEQAAVGLAADLGLPDGVDPQVSLAPRASLRHPARFDLLVAGRQGCVRLTPALHAVAGGPAQEVAAAVFANRALLVTGAVVARVIADLAAEPPGNDAAPGPGPLLPGPVRRLLRRCAELGLSLGTAKEAARRLSRLGPGLADGYGEEAVLSALLPRTVTVELSPHLYAEAIAPNAEAAAAGERELRDRLFDDLGLRIPKLRFRIADDLPGRSLRVRLHELRGVVRTGLPESYTPLEALMEVIAVELVPYAPLLLSAAQVEALLSNLDQSATMLVFNALERYPLGMMAEALRHLLAEGVSIRNLRVILDAWNGLQGVAAIAAGQGGAASEAATTLLAVSRAPVCPPVAPGDGPGTPIGARHLAGAARIALRRAETLRVAAPAAAASDEFRCWVLSPALLERLRHGAAAGRSAERDGNAAAAALLLRRIEAAMALDRHGAVPALLVPPDLRFAVVRLISGTFPDISVLSALEVPQSVRVAGTIDDAIGDAAADAAAASP